MKNVIVGITIAALIAIGSFAYAHGTSSWGGGHMHDYGFGGHMMGPGYGGHMHGPSAGYGKKYLDETADLRRELHNKKFEYFEAVRNADTDEKTITKLETEIRDIQEKLSEKAPRTAFRGGGSYGHCF